MRDYLHRTTAQIALPFGYTLTASGVLVSSIGHWPAPGLWEAWLFCAGAIVAHVAMSLLARIRFRPRDRQASLLINVVPLVAVPVAVLGSEWLQSPPVGYLVAGLLASGGYILGATLSTAAGGWLREWAGRSRGRESRPG